MYDTHKSTMLISGVAFWSTSRAKLLFICVVIVWASAILSRTGLILTKDVDIYPSDLFLYIFLGTPVLVALFVGVKESDYPYRVTLIISLAWSTISFLITLVETESSVVFQAGVMLAFIKEGLFYAAFLVFMSLLARKVSMRSNKSFKSTPKSGAT